MVEMTRKGARDDFHPLSFRAESRNLMRSLHALRLVEMTIKRSRDDRGRRESL